MEIAGRILGINHVIGVSVVAVVHPRPVDTLHAAVLTEVVDDEKLREELMTAFYDVADFMLNRP